MNILLVDDEASALRDLHRVMKPADPEEVKKALLTCAIVPDKIPCDYCWALARDVQVLSGYQGEYMSQYEWAAYRHLTNENKLLSQE